MVEKQIRASGIQEQSIAGASGDEVLRLPFPRRVGYENERECLNSAEIRVRRGSLRGAWS